jgi:PAS domain S-box-containing protein
LTLWQRAVNLVGLLFEKEDKESEVRRKSNQLNEIAAVSLLSMNLVSDEALDEHIQRLLAKIGEAMGLSRINVFRNFQEGEDPELYTSILMDWNAKGIASMKSDPFMQKMNIRKSGFGKWVQSMQQGQLFINNAEDLSVVEKAFFQRYNTTALLSVPVLLNGAWWGMLTFEIGEKEYVWQEEEISVFSAVSNLIGSVIERKRVRDDLVHSERHHRSVIETMAEGLIISDTNGNTLDCNPAAEKMLRMSREKILSLNAAELTTQLIRLDGTDFLETECPAYHSIHTGNTITNQVMGWCMEGAPELWLSVNASPLRDPLSGTIVGAVETFTDITDQVHQDRELKRNLAQKEVLLTEVHHRVKNNLAIVSSLLQLQQLYTLDEQMRNMLQNSQGRLRSMSLVHEILYKNGDFSRIPFDSYLNEIGEYLKSTFARPQQEILFEISTDECELEITKAIPCGLIVNELVTNAFKYAFADRNEGLIVISLRRNGDYFILEICDDGPGLPDSFDWKTSKTMGFTLVRTLSDQLKGVMNIENKNGARLVFTFPK